MAAANTTTKGYEDAGGVARSVPALPHNMEVTGYTEHKDEKGGFGQFGSGRVVVQAQGSYTRATSMTVGVKTPRRGQEKSLRGELRT